MMTMVMIMVICIYHVLQPWLTSMRQITASQFKARCLALMDEVAAGGEVLLITKRGRAVAELRPIAKPRPPTPFGIAAGGQILGDLIAPVVEPAEWSALEP